MPVAIAGGHGKIGLRLARVLAADGIVVRALIRNPDHAEDLRDAGAAPVVCDLEGDCEVADAIGGCDAVVFAAGAGPGSGTERKRTMDLGGAVKLIDAAKQTGVDRYLMISAMGAADPPATGGGVFGEYIRAKAEADRQLAASGLAFTIVRPGRLTDEPGTGRVTIGERLEPGAVSRDDVAELLGVALDAPTTIGATFDLVAGDAPIKEALARLGGRRP